MACVVPDGPMPDKLHRVPFERWNAASAITQEWEELAKRHRIDEPAFVVPAGLDRTAAGAVVREPDGRIWLVAPTNQFAGYQATFPKGTLDGKSMQATALVEVFEETGLDVCAPGHVLIDWALENVYEIYPQWRHRYAPGVVHNTERVFGLCIPAAVPVTLSPREHSDQVWLPWREAADRCFSPSNAEARLHVPRWLHRAG